MLSEGSVLKIPGHGDKDRNIFPISPRDVVWLGLYEEEKLTLLASLKSMGNRTTCGSHILTRIVGSRLCGETLPSVLYKRRASIKRTKQKGV